MQVLESAVLPLDALRRTFLQLATRSQVLAHVLGRRDLRLAALATAQVLVLFAVTVRVPVAMFFLGPILFGVVHLAADVRYLALRRAPSRVLLWASAAFAPVIVGLRAAAGLHVLRLSIADKADATLGMVWVALALALALGHARSWRKGALIVPAFLAAAAYVVTHARLVGLVMVHGHNAFAVLAWLLLFRRRPGWTLVPVALVVGLTLLLASGATMPWTFDHGGARAFGTRIEHLGMWIAPGVDARIAVALTAIFVFTQGVHYAVWTGWIPQDALRGEGTPTYRQTVRALSADFGAPALTLILLVALGLIGMGLWNVRQSVTWYMNLAKFHAWFELAFVAYFLVRGDFRPTPTATAT